MAINKRHTQSSRQPFSTPPPAVKQRRAADQDATRYSKGKAQDAYKMDIEDEVRSQEQEEYDSAGSDESCENDLPTSSQQLRKRAQSRLQLAAANMARNATYRGQACLV